MSDSIAPPTNPTTQPEAPVGAAHPDIDIEALLDQAQALVDDAADELNAESDPPGPAADQPAAAESPALAEAAPTEQLVVAPVLEAAPMQEEPEAVVAADRVAPAAPDEPPVAPEPPTPTSEAAPPPIDADAAPAVEDFGIASAAPQDASAPPAHESPTPAAPQSAAPPPRRSGARRAAAHFGEAALRLFDLPFAGLSDESRQRLGWAAVVTFVMGLAAWLLPLVRPHVH